MIIRLIMEVVMKHEWRKHEKTIYMPKNKPEHISVPAYKYFVVEGAGNPNDESFVDYIQVLYLLSYAIRMSHKTDYKPEDYFEYTVYPLEGIWDITDEAKKTYDGTLNKDDLTFRLMIRQPDFVTDEFAAFIIKKTMEKKDNPLLKEVVFETIEDGEVIQMMHLGPYDTEPESFAIMEEFCESLGLDRHSKVHREIYLSDVRKVKPEKLKTVLRFKVDNDRRP